MFLWLLDLHHIMVIPSNPRTVHRVGNNPDNIQPVPDIEKLIG
jgi:hypothetical protein